MNLYGTPSLLKNLAPKGNSILVQVLLASGADAICARVTLAVAWQPPQLDDVRSGDFFMSQGDFQVHFGLGDHVKADASIRRPARSKRSPASRPTSSS